MFTLIVRQSLRNRLFVLAAALMLVIYGSLLLPRMPIDVFPDLNRPTVTLMTEVAGLAPEEVDLLVSYPLETSMGGMPGVVRVRSISSPGLSIVFVEFDWNTDIYINRQQVAERLSLVREQLPAGAMPHMGPITSLMGEIMLVALTGEGASRMELRELADWVLRPRLLAIPGMSQVIPIGGEVREYRVVPDPLRMYRNAISLDEMERAVTRFGTNTGGGFIDQDEREFLIRNLGRTARIEDLRKVIIGYRQDHPVLLEQVARVDFAPRFPRGDAGYMGEDAVIVAVLKQPAADTVTLTDRVEAALAELQATMPEGVRVDQVLFRQADFIQASVDNVKQVLIEAAVVVAVVLFLFLLNGRTTFISLTAIPISILTTIIIFDVFGITINTMTLGGLAIAIGELVDDAVVDMENIFRRLRQNRELANPLPVMEVVVRASQEVRSGILYATAIMVLVFVPLFALGGLEGQLFAPLGVAYITAILASLLTAITVTPVLCYYLLPSLKRLREGDGLVLRSLKRVNARAVGWALDNPRPLIGGVVAGVIVAAASVPQLPREFLPPFNEGTVVVTMISDPGISLGDSVALGRVAERLILKVPEVTTVGRRTGRAELDEHANGVHVNEVEVDLRESARGRNEIFEDIRRRLAVLPVAIHVGQPIAHRLDHMSSGVRAQIALKIFGEDLDTLRRLAREFEEKMAAVPGVTDLWTERQTRIPQLQVRLDYEKAAIEGFGPAELTGKLERLAQGRVLSEVAEGNRRFDVVLRLDDSDRTAEGLARLMVDGPGGRQPLGAVAEVIEAEGPNEILRENGLRRIVVQANSDGTDMATIVRQIRALIAETELPQEYSIALEGQFLAQEEAQRMIALLSLVSLALIFLVLYSRYRSVPLTLIIICNVPLALIGAVAALWIAGLSLSVASMVGFITLAGISARNGILKISHYINLSLYEGETFGRQLIIRGSQERLAPVLMTALSAGLALTPLLFGAESPGKEILHPVAVVIFGGLFSATLLDALLVPVLFQRFGAPAIERLRQQLGEEMKPQEAF